MKEKKMFTIKLRRSEERRTRTELYPSALEDDPAQNGVEIISHKGTFLVEAKTVGIFILKPDTLVELSGVAGTGEKFCFYIQNPECNNFPGTMHFGIPSNAELWDEAYIENSSGATTEIIRF
jgi:hypothetical protein